MVISPDLVELRFATSTTAVLHNHQLERYNKYAYYNLRNHRLAWANYRSNHISFDDRLLDVDKPYLSPSTTETKIPLHRANLEIPDALRTTARYLEFFCCRVDDVPPHGHRLRSCQIVLAGLYDPLSNINAYKADNASQRTYSISRSAADFSEEARYSDLDTQ